MKILLRRLWMPLMLALSFWLILYLSGYAKWASYALLPESLHGVAGWGVFVLIVVGISVPLMYPLRRQVDQLRTAASRLRDGDLSSRAPVFEGALTAEVSATFNEMAERLGRTVTEQENLLQTLAHEVRTPLARMRFILEDLHGAQSLETIKPDVAELDAEITELEGLVDEVLGGLDPGRAGHERVAQEVSALVQDVLARLPPHGDAIAVETQGLDGATPPINVVPAEVHRVLRNLVANAMAHAGTRVRIEARVESGTLLLVVDDDGPGVAKDQRSEVLQPFTQGHQKAGGLGLGLAIANRICLAYGGPIHVGDSPLGGARFQTRWPLVNAEAP